MKFTFSINVNTVNEIIGHMLPVKYNSHYSFHIEYNTNTSEKWEVYDGFRSGDITTDQLCNISRSFCDTSNIVACPIRLSTSDTSVVPQTEMTHLHH